jgi:hypothetical protein
VGDHYAAWWLPTTSSNVHIFEHEDPANPSEEYVTLRTFAATTKVTQWLCGGPNGTLAERLTDTRLRMTGERIIDDSGRESIRIEQRPARNNRTVARPANEWLVSPDFAYAVVRFRMLQNDVPIREETIECVRAGPDVWFPRKVTTRVWEVPPPGAPWPAQLQLRMTDTIETKDVVIGRVLAPEAFSLTERGFPRNKRFLLRRVDGSNDVCFLRGGRLINATMADALEKERARQSR